LIYMIWHGDLAPNMVTVGVTLAVVAGLSLVIDPWHAKPAASLIGIALAFSAALATATRIYVYGRQTKDRYPAVVGAENFLIAAVVVSLCSLAAPPHLPTSFVGMEWLALTALSTTVGACCMFFSISLIGSFRYSLFAKFDPISTIFFSIFLVNETLKPQQYVGMAIVLSGLVLYQLSEQRRKQTA